MALAVEANESDLILPLPDPDEKVHPYTVHTHYFGFTVPEARIGAFLYARYMPAFGMSQGGPVIFRGMENVAYLDAAFSDYRATMPWPEVHDGLIRFESGYEIEFPEPGVQALLRYRSPDGSVSFELEQRAATPLIKRGHIVPGEDDFHDDPGRKHGGTEQFMHCTGELRLRGERFDVDCYAVRDRSWNQVRTEEPDGARPTPPIGWTPAFFGDDLAFNVTSFEAPDTDPAWIGVVDVPAGTPTSYHKWLVSDGRLVEITDVRRNVLEYHPILHSAIRQELDITDETGRIHHFDGHALAAAPAYSWPNVTFVDHVFEWRDESGRTAHCTYQEIWWEAYQHRMSGQVAS